MSDSENPILAADREEGEKKKLIEEIEKLEQGNRILESRLKMSTKEKVDEIQQVNSKLKLEFEALEKALYGALENQKYAMDNSALTTRFESLKNATIDYCNDRKLDPETWKNIESLS